MRRPYAEAGYRAMLAVVRRGGYGCWRPGCAAPAVTLDHVPALADHAHVEGSGCCQLRPSCVPCNLSAGAAVGNRRRRRGSRSRLGAGSGWST